MKFLYYSGWTLTRVISTLFFRIKVSGQENFPNSGGFILATNHISYYDPLLVGSWAPREVYFFAKKELFKNKIFGEIIRRTNALPVKRGTVDRESLKLSEEVIRNGFGLVVYPEGTRSKTDSFLEAKPGVGLLAVRAQCTVVPGYVHGSNRLKECFWGKEKMSITFGEPFSAEWVKGFPAEKGSYQQIADAVMGRIAEIKARTVGLKK